MDHNPALAAARSLLAQGEHVHLVADGEPRCLGNDCAEVAYPFPSETTGA